MIKLILFDVSGTLVTGNGTTAGGFLMGRGDELKKLDEKWKANEISIGDLLIKIFYCWRGLHISKAEEIYNTLKYRYGVKEVIRTLKNKEIKIGLLTNIPIQEGKFFRRDLNPDYMTGTGLEVVDDVFTGKVLDLHDDKLKDSLEIIKKENVDPNEVVFVGDEKHDAVVFDHVKFGISMDGDEICNERAKYKITDFREILDIVERES